MEFYVSVYIISGVANKLMGSLEYICDSKNCYYVDLFVRVSNKMAISFYKKLGYIVYRTVRKYYSGEEDAYDMRKALSIDKHKWSLVPVDNSPIIWL